ncbi:MAG: holo-ACP synthase [Sporomusaceae bacterium]|nr:holo-ACP synthase [Sporomusaceae bacterium]
MIIGIGLDIVEIDRIAAAIEKDSFVKRVFTPAEQAYCESLRAGCAASFAARFAAKEAFLKALGTGLREGKWIDMEVLPDELGAPHLSLSGRFAEMAEEKGISEIYISLTHAKKYAAAQVICWGGKKI